MTWCVSLGALFACQEGEHGSSCQKTYLIREAAPSVVKKDTREECPGGAGDYKEDEKRVARKGT